MAWRGRRVAYGEETEGKCVSSRLVCALEKLKGKDGKPECQKGFRQNRPWQKCCCRKHQKRFDYLEQKRSAGRRRKARGRAQAAANAPRAHFTRVSSRRYVEVGSIREALAVVGWTRRTARRGSAGWSGRSGGKSSPLRS